jgi:lysozyme
MPVLGIDVSSYQAEVDWFAVARSDVRFAFAKATEGSSHVDARFVANWRNTGEAGLLRGAYHFGRPNGDPEAQAAHFAAVVGPPTFRELPPVLDLEVSGGLPPGRVVEWALAFVRRAEALFGRSLIIYTGGLWRRELGNPDVPDLRSHLLWTARYGSQEPVVPRTWSRWDIWQFTDGQSGEVIVVPGVSGPCDCNRFRGDLAELEALAAQVSTPARPTEPVPPQGGRPPWPGRFFIWPQLAIVRGEDVRIWQTRLRDRQFAVTPDGAYGPESRRACIAFQRELGLEPDGIVGRETWDATFAES